MDPRDEARNTLMSLLGGGGSISPVAATPPGVPMDLASLLNNPAARPAAAAGPDPRIPPMLGRSTSGGVVDLLSSVLGAAAAAPMVNQTRQNPVSPSIATSGDPGAALLSLLKAPAVEAPTVVAEAKKEEPVATKPAMSASSSVFTYVDPFLEARLHEEREKHLQTANEPKREDAIVLEPDGSSVDAERPEAVEDQQTEPAEMAANVSSPVASPVPLERTQSGPALVVTPPEVPSSPIISVPAVMPLQRSPSLTSPPPRSPTPTNASSWAAGFKSASSLAKKAIDVREQKQEVTENGAPAGYRVPEDLDVSFDVRLPHERGISPADLAEEKIALMSIEMDFKSGKLVASNGSYIAYAVRGGKVRILDAESGAKDMLEGLGNSVVDMAMSPLSNTLAVIGDDSRLLIVDLPPFADTEVLDKEGGGIDHRVSVEIVGRGQSRFTRVVWSVTGEWIAATGNKGEIWLLNVKDLASKPGGGSDGRRVYSEEDEEDIPGAIAVYESECVDLAFSTSAPLLATMSANGVVRLFRLPDLSMVTEVDAAPSDGNGSFIDFVSVPNEDQPLRLIMGWDMNRVLAISTLRNGHFDSIQKITFVDPEAQDSFYNAVVFEQRSGSVVVANSLRASFVILKVDDRSGAFEFLVEYPISSPPISLIVASKSEDSTSFGLLAAQTKSISQHTFEGWGESEVFGDTQREKAPLFEHSEARRPREERSASRSRSRSRSRARNAHYASLERRSATIEKDAGSDLLEPPSTVEAEANINSEVAEAILQAENETAEEVERGSKNKLGPLSSPVVSMVESALAGEGRMPAPSPNPLHDPSSPSSHARADAKELQRMEENLFRKFEQVIRSEQQRHLNLLEKERLRYRAEEIERHEQVLKTVAATLTTTVSRQLDSVVAREIQSKVIPAVQASVSDSMKSLEPRIGSIVDERIVQALAAITTKPEVTKSVADSISSTFAQTLKSTIAELVVPSIQKILAGSLAQVNGVIKTGVTEIAEASVAAINASAQSSAIAASSLQSYIHTLSSRGIQSPADAASAAPVASIQVSRSAPEPTPSEDTVFAEMESAIANNDIDGAFTRALSRQHAKAVNFLIHRFDPVVVTKGNALSQPVILSLLQYLSQADLLDDTATKVAWLQNSMAALEPSDESIGPHVKRIMQTVAQNLQMAIRKLHAAGHPSTSIVNSLAITAGQLIH